MSKELNILQAIEMPVGTEFKILNAGKDDENSAYSKTAIVSVSECNSKILLGDGVDEFGFNDYIAGLKFEVIQKPVSFMEAIKTGHRIKVEHNLIEDILLNKADEYFRSDSSHNRKALERFRNKEFMSANYLFSALGYLFDNLEIAEIIADGKWYIEEE